MACSSGGSARCGIGRPAAHVLAVVGVAVTLSSDAAAQAREGFWGELGVGVAAVQLSAGEQTGDRQGAGAGLVSAGWAINPRVVVGAEFRASSFDVTGDFGGSFSLFTVAGTVLV